MKLTEEEAKANAGKTVELTFKAKIKDGANLSEYVNEDGVTRVPNTAKYNFNNDPGTEKNLNQSQLSHQHQVNQKLRRMLTTNLPKH